jgi:6-phosphogluconolactonase
VPGRDATHVYAVLSGGAVRVYPVSSEGPLGPYSQQIGTGLSPSAAAVSPNGAYLFVANSGANSVSRYSIDSVGTLASLGSTPTGPTADTGTGPAAIAMTPDGAHLYTADAGDNKISRFTVGSDGSLTADGLVDAGLGPAGLAVTPDGGHLYATNSGSGTVSGWKIDADGSLDSLGNLDPLRPNPAVAGAGARGIAISPDGTRLLTANPGDGTVSRFIIGADGLLTPAFGLAPSFPGGSQSVTISPDGKHAYVGGSSSMQAYDLSITAAMTPRGAAQSSTGSIASIAITPNQGPEAKFNAVASATGHASTFEGGPSIDNDGAVGGWAWDFGDGTSGEGQTITHVYQQPGSYTVRVTVTDGEGCSTAPVYTGQALSCAPGPYASATQLLNVVVAPPEVTPPQDCAHDGDDGFCGTPDHKAPSVTVLGFNDGQSLTTLDAPEDLVGTVTPDPSGIQSIALRFSKAAGTIAGKKTVRKKVCRKVKGKRKCKRKKVVVKTKTKIPACLTVSGTKNYLVKYVCSKVKWVTIAGDATFRYSLPVALGIGSYTLDVIATDGAGNADVLEPGRNQMKFKVVTTPPNSGDGSGDTGGGGTTTTTPTPPVNDTGSPFGH